MTIIETKAYLKGYLAALGTNVQNTRDEDSLWSLNQKLMYNEIVTEVGTLGFTINRGICPVGGNVTYACTSPENSTVDIYLGWADNKFFKEAFEGLEMEFVYQETRISIEELEKLLYVLEIKD